MPLLDLIASSGFGSLLGMRHAFEPDHLAAVTSLVSRERSTWRAALLGACWGLGHTMALLIVGAVLIVLRAELPERVADVFELGVAFMLIGLGIRAVMQAAREGSVGPLRMHRHFWAVHQHSGMPAHMHIGGWTFARRPLLVGAVHGLAGSGALTALVVTTLPSTAAQLVYVALFGLGSTMGMAALSGLLGWPIARLSANRRVGQGLSILAGALSMALGVAWGYPLAVRLF